MVNLTVEKASMDLKIEDTPYTRVKFILIDSDFISWTPQWTLTPLYLTKNESGFLYVVWDSSVSIEKSVVVNFTYLHTSPRSYKKSIGRGGRKASRLGKEERW